MLIRVNGQGEEIDIQEIRLQTKYLEKEVSHLLEQMNNQEQTTQQTIQQKVSAESGCINANLIITYRIGGEVLLYSKTTY